jgi:hypothetical protein
MLRWSRHRIEAATPKQGAPIVAITELRRFMLDELTKPQREALAGLARVKKFVILQRLYFFSTDRLADTTAADISGGLPLHGGQPLHGGPPHRPPHDGPPHGRPPHDGPPPERDHEPPP